MEHGIAQVFVLAGLEVALTDSDVQILEKAKPRIQANLATCLDRGFVDKDKAAAAPAHITLVSNLADAVPQADSVIEVVFENLDVKREVLCQVEEHCPAHAVITSTTSSFRAADLAVVLVYPALVKKDVPGFVGNRLQHALRREAIAIVAQGIASPEDVDLIARLSFGLRLLVVGPLESVDLGGLDLTQAIQTYLLPELDRSTEPRQLIRDKVTRGELGAETGKGFYGWPPGRAARVIRRRDETLLEIVRWLRARGFLRTPSDQRRDKRGKLK